MTDGFMVCPEEVQALAGKFQERQGVPNEVATAIQSASTVQTGDPGLDAETRELATELGTVLQSLARILTTASEGLDRVAQDYVDTDDFVGSLFDQIQGGDDGSGEDGTPVASDTGIADRLTPTA
jgi:hypothetical protein